MDELSLTYEEHRALRALLEALPTPDVLAMDEGLFQRLGAVAK